MTGTGRGGPPDTSALVRAAEWLGRTLGDWRRRRAGSRDDKFIRVWKRAWTAGCESRWNGLTRQEVPHKQGPEHDTWLAGWLWADTQPDRRDPNRAQSFAHPRRRAIDHTE